MKKARFLVFRGGAIGDFILTLPALAALRRGWPDAHIEIAGYPHVARLAQVSGLADAVVSLDRAETAELFSLRPSFSASQREYLSSFDVIVTYLHDPGGTMQENLAKAGARQVIHGSPIVTSGHAVEHFIAPLSRLAIFPEGRAAPELRLPETARAAGRLRLAALGAVRVAIHPGSGSPTKNWPLQSFLELAGRGAKAGVGRPFLSIGEADAELAADLQGHAPAIPVLSGVDLVDLAGVLCNCSLYVGNDSGITHLAAAVGVPTVALFGPSDPERWSPRGAHVRVVASPARTTESLADVPVDVVWKAAQSALHGQE